MSRNRAELNAIADAMGLVSRDASNKQTLIKWIKTYMDEHPELATQPRFQGLFAYRANTGPEGGKKSSGVKKTSADKTIEDIAAAKQASDGQGG